MDTAKEMDRRKRTEKQKDMLRKEQQHRQALILQFQEHKLKTCNFLIYLDHQIQHFKILREMDFCCLVAIRRFDSQRKNIFSNKKKLK